MWEFFSSRIDGIAILYFIFLDIADCILIVVEGIFHMSYVMLKHALDITGSYS
jgi:hypothetical protein